MQMVSKGQYTAIFQYLVAAVAAHVVQAEYDLISERYTNSCERMWQARDAIASVDGVTNENDGHDNPDRRYQHINSQSELERILDCGRTVEDVSEKIQAHRLTNWYEEHVPASKQSVQEDDDLFVVAGGGGVCGHYNLVLSQDGIGFWASEQNAQGCDIEIYRGKYRFAVKDIIRMVTAESGGDRIAIGLENVRDVIFTIDRHCDLAVFRALRFDNGPDDSSELAEQAHRTLAEVAIPLEQLQLLADRYGDQMVRSRRTIAFNWNTLEADIRGGK